MAVVNVSGSQYSFLPLASVIPNARVLGPVSLSLATSNTYVLDLSAPANSGQLKHSIQSMYVDASNLYGFLLVTVAGTQQTIRIEGGSQGYFPISVSGTNIFTFSYQVAVDGTQWFSLFNTASIHFYNVPMVGATWETSPQCRANVPLNWGNFILATRQTTTAALALVPQGEAILLNGWTFQPSPVAANVPVILTVKMSYGVGTPQYWGQHTWFLDTQPRSMDAYTITGQNQYVDTTGVSAWLTLSSAITNDIVVPFSVSGRWL